MTNLVSNPTPETLAAPQNSAPPLPTWMAALQVFLVCGIPTQLFVSVILLLPRALDPAGLEELVESSRGGHPPLTLVATIGLVDTAMIALLIRVFLWMSREHSRDVLVGRRPVLGEIWRGLLLAPIAVVVVQGIVAGLRYLLPGLHNVAVSPFDGYLDSPVEGGVFLLVAILVGGVREELQRGFILHRFQQRLGGIWVGLVAFSLLFAALHYDQGWDVALAVGVLGVCLGLLFIKRQSVVMSMAMHVGFNSAQVVAQILLRSSAT